MSETLDSSRILPDRNSTATLRRQSRRAQIDRAFGWVMAVGGIGVIVAVLLIFVYLLFVVLPIFDSARVEASALHPTVEVGPVGGMALDEYGRYATVVTRRGEVRFLSTTDGEVLEGPALPLEGVAVTAVSALDAPAGIFAVGMADGRVVIGKQSSTVSYVGDERTVSPGIEFPLGEAPLILDDQGRPIEAVVVQGEGDNFLIAADLPAGAGVIASYTRSESLLDEGVELERSVATLPLPEFAEPRLLLDPARQNLYVQTGPRELLHLDVRDPSAPVEVGRTMVSSAPAAITSLRLLAGGISVLVGDSAGQVGQWFTVRDAENIGRLTLVRSFNVGTGAIAALAPEPARKGFAAWVGDATTGQSVILHSTSERRMLELPTAGGNDISMAFSARADSLAILTPGKGLQVYRLSNPHPEISFRSLWQPVWYESRDRPEYIWQSSSASDDFEPKFSLVPLTFGTLKGAFYAMVLAVPLAIMGAIYTGYFMSGRMRRTVKPLIEVMAALPTVILGFLAGLWLAPLVETALPGVIAAILLLPFSVLLAAWFWSRLPNSFVARLPDSIEVWLLIPVIGLVVCGSLALSPWVEAQCFGGDAPGWLTRNLGLGFDQRNSLVVGLAMGFAIIPNIFSIAEDAVFGVPKHLTVGSLALGATPWQTLTRVVLLTASPGIFSGVMIGFGRAVGETMIVLMATGNTPIMSMNIFQGFRALSANVATEMPESAVNSTHFRVLFLAALVLFVVTFLFNTVAEVVRSRLRGRYSTL